MSGQAKVFVYGHPVNGVDALIRQLSDGVDWPALTLTDDAVADLAATGLVVPTGHQLKPGPGLATFPATLRDGLLGVLAPFFQRYGSVLGPGLSGLRALAEEAGYTPHGRFVHLLVIGHVLDLGVCRYLLSEAIFQSEPRPCWIWAFEGGTGTENRCGVRLWRSPEQNWYLGQLWYNKTEQPHHQFSPTDLAAIGSLWHPEQQSRFAANLLRLQFCRVAKCDNAVYRAAVPVISSRPENRFWVAIDGLAKQVAAAVVAPALDAARHLSGRLSEVHPDCFLHGVYRLLLDHSVDWIVKAGLIPPLPADPWPGFGLWIGEGHMPIAPSDIPTVAGKEKAL